MSNNSCFVWIGTLLYSFGFSFAGLTRHLPVPDPLHHICRGPSCLQLVEHKFHVWFCMCKECFIRFTKIAVTGLSTRACCETVFGAVAMAGKTKTAGLAMRCEYGFFFLSENGLSHDIKCRGFYRKLKIHFLCLSGYVLTGRGQCC